MENRQRKNYEIEINIGEIIVLLFRKIKWIILLSSLGALLAVVGTKIFITPQYQSVTKMYVLAQQEGEVLTTSDMQTSAYLAKDYAELIKSRTVAENVISNLGLKMTPEMLLNKITVYTQSDTRIVTIVVMDENPNHACELADMVRVVSSEQIKNVMNSQAVNVVDKANIPKDPVSPNIMKNGIKGGIAGACLSILNILIWFFMNGTIQTADDVEKYLNLSTLGTIPMNSKDKKSRKRANKTKRR